MKQIYMLGLLILSACTTSSNKETTSPQPKPEAAVEDGVVIQLQPKPDTLKGSLKSYAKGHVGEASIQINYYSPAVRGRMIWGGLVAFDDVWVTGAHKATNVIFDKALVIGGQEIPAGKYGFFTIPSKENWTVIINKNWDQHLTDEYDAKDDILRYTVAPQMTEVNQERLMYSIESVGGGSAIVLRWEKTKIEIPVAAK